MVQPPEPSQSPLTPQVRDLTLRQHRTQARDLAVQQAFRGTPLFGVIQARRQDGELPVVMPRIILQAPLWCSARAARLTQGMHFEWVQPDPDQRGLPVEWVVETINPLDHNHGETVKREGDPFGRLQWFDQDLLFCLTLEFFRRNCQTTFITVDQTSVLQWIGYRQVHDPPYAELRSSIKRMGWTQIAWYRKGEKEHAKGIDLLSKESGWERGTRSRPGEIVALLSDSWLKQIYDADGDRQIIDLTRYFHLVRHIRNNEGAPDLARSVFTFLASLADREQTTTAKTSWLIERFAQRQLVRRADPKTGQIAEKVHLRFADPLRQGQLADALQVLVKSGICREIAIDGDKLQVQWTPAKTIAALPIAAPQQKLFDTDLRTGTVLVIGQEGTPDLASKSLQKAVGELRARTLVSAHLEAKVREEGWKTLQLASVYGAAIHEQASGVITDAGAYVAQAFSEPADDWWPDTIRERKPELYRALFGDKGLFRHQAREIAEIAQGREIVASTAAMLPAAPAPGPSASGGSVSYLEQVLGILRPRVRVDRRLEAKALSSGGWSEAELARLYLTALYLWEHERIRGRPGAWAAAILRGGYREEWTQQGLREQTLVPHQDLQAWATSTAGPLHGVPTAPPAPRNASSKPLPDPANAGPAGSRVAESKPTGAPGGLVAFVPALRARVVDIRGYASTADFARDKASKASSKTGYNEGELQAVQHAITVLGGVMSGRAPIDDLLDAAAALVSADHDPATTQIGAEILAELQAKR